MKVTHTTVGNGMRSFGNFCLFHMSLAFGFVPQTRVLAVYMATITFRAPLYIMMMDIVLSSMGMLTKQRQVSDRFHFLNLRKQQSENTVTNFLLQSLFHNQNCLSHSNNSSSYFRLPFHTSKSGTWFSISWNLVHDTGPFTIQKKKKK